MILDYNRSSLAYLTTLFGGKMVMGERYKGIQPVWGPRGGSRKCFAGKGLRSAAPVGTDFACLTPAKPQSTHSLPTLMPLLAYLPTLKPTTLGALGLGTLQRNVVGGSGLGHESHSQGVYLARIARELRGVAKRGTRAGGRSVAGRCRSMTLSFARCGRARVAGVAAGLPLDHGERRRGRHE